MKKRAIFGMLTIGWLLVCSAVLAQQIKTAEEFALNLQRNFEENGYDVTARANHQHELILTSDSFQDASTRDSTAGALMKDPKTLCNLGIWYIRVGYSKGLLSTDVMKTVSLGCPAARTARIEETKPLRQEIARAADDPDGSGRVHAHSEGTTLVIESPYFFDDPQNGVTFAKAMAQKLLEDPEKLCNAAITQLRMKGRTRTVKTVTVSCK